MAAVALFSFGFQVAFKEGVSCIRVQEEIDFLYALFKREFFFGYQQNKDNLIKKMKKTNVFKRNNNIENSVNEEFIMVKI